MFGSSELQYVAMSHNGQFTTTGSGQTHGESNHQKEPLNRRLFPPPPLPQGVDLDDTFGPSPERKALTPGGELYPVVRRFEDAPAEVKSLIDPTWQQQAAPPPPASESAKL